MRVAAIDCGTNSVRLLIAEQRDGVLHELVRRLELVRLGEEVDATGRLAPAAIDRTVRAVSAYAEEIARHQVTKIRFVATSAVRDVINREDFFAPVRRRLGVEPEVISGLEEAQLSFSGALAGIGPVPDPALVMDVGGGSTELALGRAGQVEQSISLNIGSVRLTERFLHDDPPTGAQIRQAREMIDVALVESGMDFEHVATWIGVAGTVTSLSAIQQGLTRYEPEKVHGSTLEQKELIALIDTFLTSPVDILERSPLLPRRRAEVIAAGALIVERVAARLNVDRLVVSESDILDGLAMGLATTPTG